MKNDSVGAGFGTDHHPVATYLGGVVALRLYAHTCRFGWHEDGPTNRPGADPQFWWLVGGRATRPLLDLLSHGFVRENRAPDVRDLRHHFTQRRMTNIREQRLHRWSSSVLGAFAVTTPFDYVALCRLSAGRTLLDDERTFVKTVQKRPSGRF
jgi:hypothetical protein